MHLRHGWVAFVSLAIVAFPSPGAEKPNIVIILADDLGWRDLGCYGADLLETPRLDRFAQNAVRFTDAYAPGPVCTPTRASLLTGKYPARLGITIWSEGSHNQPRDRKLIPASSKDHLPYTEETLAKRLQKSGYFTASVGKWHLGDADNFPEAHGFDVNIGGTHWGAPRTYFWPYRGEGRPGGDFRYVPHLEFGQANEYLTDRLTEEALRVIDHAGNRPFFLYLAHHAPHTPMEAKPADVAHFAAKLKPAYHHQNPTYAAMVKSVDESVGRVLDHLDRRGLSENTIVIFTSDNGGYTGADRRDPGRVHITDNTPLRSGKGSCYEGGLRVPLLVRWPGVTKGDRVCSRPVMLTDIFLTVLEVVHLPASGTASDGVSLAKLLRQPELKWDRGSLPFHYPHYYETSHFREITSPMGALRVGAWKLVEHFESGRVELFNLESDLGETHDLARQMPDKTRELLTQLQDWRKSVKAEMPRPNPAFKALP